jgi:aryl sulfotransferase
MVGASLARPRGEGAGGVTRTFWLASYPKSGNTWMRVLIAYASNPAEEPININEMPDPGIAGDCSSFEYAALIDPGLLTHDEVDRLRPRVHAILARYDVDLRPLVDMSRVQFIKVHDAYTLNSVGEPLLGGILAADGAIVIVRDPRDVAPSLAHHANCSVDKAITFMSDDDAASCQGTDRQPDQLLQKLRGWSAHVASWRNQKDIPVYLIRYEDLRSDTAGTLSRALAFAGVQVTQEQIDRAVASSEFRQLQRHEQKNGFAEAFREGTKFFRRGNAGGWRDELTREQIVRIESHHGRMMRSLGYELSYESSLACTG